ncbi:MAG TPA: hypothetical protein VEW25_09240 [Allosphingosinicella sp.]|nr:hypothetical protein [Allosphingosinicella sp.]
MRSERVTAGQEAAEMVWLLGQPHLADFLDFVREKVVGGAAIPPKRLADEWRAANDHYYDLEKSEAGAADGIESLPLPPEMRPLARRLRANRYFRRAFDTLPVRIRMVELDRLIVSQLHVERQFVDALSTRLDPAAGPEALFHFCQPAERRVAPVRAEQLGPDRFRFSSESTDFRANPSALLAPALAGKVPSFGPASAAIALVVGYGSNFLSVVASGGRMVLHNGYHRAYALRALGFTHAPCVVTEVTRKDELRVAASEKVSADPEFYFAAKRPPLLRDFFDPKLRKILRVVRMETVIEVELKVRTSTAAEL